MTLVPGGAKTELPRLGAMTLRSSTLKMAMTDAIETLEDGSPSLSQYQQRILAIAKALLIAADMAGSALPKEQKDADWIASALGTRATEEDRWTLLRKKLKSRPLRPFQEAAASSTAPWTFLKAGCGTGKTAGACAWGARQHAGRQLWLTYPTTGTATEGFRDYVLEADLEGALVHSRAELDLAILGTGEEGEDDRQRARELALRGWAADTVVATVDTVLGLMQNQRAGHYAYPGICDGALVFDELHAYDDRLFACLLRFLEAHPGLPCLFMTASLQAGRQQALESLCQRLHQRGLEVIPGPEGLETLPRYHRLQGDPWEAATTSLKAGGKVLWVSNTVARCQAVADQAETRIWGPLRYHSRYRYLDRLDRHRDVVEAFCAPGPAFASTTQVAEMSLDLSASLLVMDRAPVPAMIQRLGRLNRRAEPGGPTCPFVIVEPEDAMPYTDQELQEARDWLARLGDGPLSQQDLLDDWQQDSRNQGGNASAYWLDEDLWTRPGSIREPTPGMSVLLEEDWPKVQRREYPASACLIPMPPKSQRRGLLERGHLLIAPSTLITYDPLRGAAWQ